MANFNEQELRRVISNIAKNNNFSDNLNIELSSGSGKGDGYTGVMIMIKVEDKNTSQELHLIAKNSMKDGKVREVFPVQDTFSNEIIAYETIIPRLHDLQQRFNISEGFNSTAKFYAADNKKNGEYLILENLRISGFEMRSLKDLLDHEHMKHIFEIYGELHALSFAMKILRPEEFQHFEGKLINMWTALSKLRLAEILQEMQGSIRQAVKEKGYENKQLDYYVDNYITFLKGFEHHGEKKFSCVVHGDCWSNNLMFKYGIQNGHKQLEAIKLLDWQVCSIGPPVYDLCYSMYSGASKEVLDNFETYLIIYHEKLSNFLKHFNLDANLVYPYNELRRQWKKHYHYGAVLGTLTWKIRASDNEQVVDSINYKADDDSTYFDGIVRADCDKEYLHDHIKILYEHLNKLQNLDW